MPGRRKPSAIALALVALGASCPPSADAGGGHTIAVSAIVLSKNSCTFSTASSSISLVIDPSSGAMASGAGSVTFRCTGSSATAIWATSDDGGLFNAAGKRMRHATSPTDFLPYSLSYTATGSAPKNVTQTITVTASVAPADFQNALAGNYSDTVVLSIAP